jgi:DNA mismatch repair protein MutL
VGETFNSYIVVELDDKMLIIDKHAAHERIIFEQLKRNMYASEVASQLLMLPIEIMLMSDEVDVIEEYRAEIEAVGFEFTTSRNTVLVNALPIGIEQDAVSDMLAVIADRIKNGTGSVDITRNIVFEKALYQASCKAAIKAGREYPEGHQKWIVDQLMKLPDITFCPHGRPVAMEMSKKNIDRQFERT